jgi:restriction system protein
VSNFILVRSPEVLTERDWAGYGWEKVKFSEFKVLSELLDELIGKYGSLGRKKNQITRFFNIKKGDVVVVPVSKHIVLGYATDEKCYESGIGYGENRVKVSFLRDNDRNIIKIPRNQLSQAFSSRLKIRMAISPLNEFSDEISTLLTQVENDGGVSFNSRFLESEESALNDFKGQLLANIKQGKTNLESGGYGLEKLVLELLKIEGYKGHILAKNQSSDIADADIEASRSDTFTSTRLVIQVKHHDGSTGEHGINQLRMLDDEDDVHKWLITTGNLSKELLEKAKNNNIFVMEGSEFVDWLCEHLTQLSPMTKYKLHISDVPMISSLT